MNSNWKYIVVALVLGIAIGAVGTIKGFQCGLRGSWKNPEKMHQRMLKEFTSKLNLTPDQQQKVSAILDDTGKKITTLREEVHPKFEAIRNSTRAQIREILTPEQQKKFDVISEKMDARFKEHRQKETGPGTI